MVLSAEVTGAFGADADNQARERLMLAFVLPFLLACLVYASHIIVLRKKREKNKRNEGGEGEQKGAKNF